MWPGHIERAVGPHPYHYYSTNFIFYKKVITVKHQQSTSTVQVDRRYRGLDIRKIRYFLARIYTIARIFTGTAQTYKWYQQQ
jgi:hypothetical protein